MSQPGIWNDDVDWRKYFNNNVYTQEKVHHEIENVMLAVTLGIDHRQRNEISALPCCFTRAVLNCSSYVEGCLTQFTLGCNLCLLSSFSIVTHFLIIKILRVP